MAPKKEKYKTKETKIESKWRFMQQNALDNLVK